jgi:hypothetical protein
MVVQSQIFNSIFVSNVTVNSYLHLTHPACNFTWSGVAFCIAWVHFWHPVLYISRKVWACSYMYQPYFSITSICFLAICTVEPWYYENLKNSCNVKVLLYICYHFYWLETSGIFIHIWNLTKKSFGITGLVIAYDSLHYNTFDWSLVNYSTDWIQNTSFKMLTLTFWEYH